MSRGTVTLGIETSCDDTCVAVLRDTAILANLMSSQVEIHGPYGGVVPELAARAHADSILPLLDEALRTAGVASEDVDLIAVTAGPGLVGALLIGVGAAKSLAWAWNRPLVGVNHVEAHIYAHVLDGVDQGPWPAVCLVVSGGHTDLIAVGDDGSARLLGETRDDAAGEAFDKVARLLDLGFPGGPVIDRLAGDGDASAISFPRARLEDGSLDFSFSGLKTAVAVHVERHGIPEGQALADLAASFQEAVVDVLVDKSLDAARRTGHSTILAAGGVSANSRLRAGLTTAASAAGLEAMFPPPALCTDNAAMVAAAGLMRWRRHGPDGLDLGAYSQLRVGEEGWAGNGEKG